MNSSNQEYVFVQEVRRGEAVHIPGERCYFVGNVARGSRVRTLDEVEIVVPLGAVRPRRPEAVAA